MNRPALPATDLDAAGLNRQHVFTTRDLPADILAALNPAPHETQLILLGHGGRKLWECVQAAGPKGDDPVDDYTVRVLASFFARHCPQRHYRIVYPGDTALGLQSLGALAGWHHKSPFMVGVDPYWGSWHAYRAVVLADTDFQPGGQPGASGGDPCQNCRGRPCIDACPAAATGEVFDLAACLAERLQPASACAFSCLSRLACPVGREHRYDEAQLRHSYGHSLRMLEKWPAPD